MFVDYDKLSSRVQCIRELGDHLKSFKFYNDYEAFDSDLDLYLSYLRSLLVLDAISFKQYDVMFKEYQSLAKKALFYFYSEV